jgi:uncharacterized protein YcaQ
LKNKQLTLKEARKLALYKQGLLQPGFAKEKKGALAVIEHLGYVQIDTLSVVARAHHHTLWSRLPDYREKFLNELLEKDKQVFEYWSHAASYLPMKDYRFSLPLKKAYAEGKSHWFGQDKDIMKYVFDRIKAEGALQSKDFEHKRETTAGWYEWKPAKRALEQLFMQGKLMVARRQGFQKVYDLTERVLPSDVDLTFPSQEEYAGHLILKAVQAHGVIHESEIAYLRSRLKEPVKKALKNLLEKGSLTEVSIESLDKMKFITTNEFLEITKKIKLNDLVHFLSPFDNTVIQRKRLSNFFNFDYLIECYVPEGKRKYGYFTLPVLYRDKFVGRFDPKADRAKGIFYVKSLHFEKDFKPDEKFKELFSEKLKEFALFNGCREIVFADGIINIYK